MKRIFISFASEDVALRNLLKGQARNESSPFEFIDMSVKEPWDTQWKTNCRTKIKKCDGMIAIITHSSERANGQIWEIKCAQEEDIPVIGIYGNNNCSLITIPNVCNNIKIIPWEWESIADWLNQL